MSRSFRHTPIHGITTSDSEKWSKRKANRALRCAERVYLGEAQPPLRPAPVLRQVSNVWLMPKDGKHWFGGFVPTPEDCGTDWRVRARRK